MPVLIACLAWLALAFPGLAQPLPLPDEDHAAWQAIGRVNIRGYKRRGMCSGTLIAPDQVLTAAHCVLRAGRVVRASDIVFVAGWLRGDYVAASGARDVKLFDDVRQGDLTPQRDLALITLSDAMTVSPIPLAELPPPGERAQGPYAMLGYLGTRPHVLSASFGCTGVWGYGLLRLPCPTVPGNSGGPIIQFTRDGPRVVAVVSQSNSSLSLSTPVDPLPSN